MVCRLVKWRAKNEMGVGEGKIVCWSESMGMVKTLWGWMEISRKVGQDRKDIGCEGEGKIEERGECIEEGVQRNYEYEDIKNIVMEKSG